MLLADLEEPLATAGPLATDLYYPFWSWWVSASRSRITSIRLYL